MILLFGNIVDAWVIKTEISEMKSSIGVVGVRLYAFLSFHFAVTSVYISIKW